MRFTVIYRDVALNGQVDWVLTQPEFAPEETKPKKLTFATGLSFAKRPMFTDVLDRGYAQ